jgi:sugar lactone lactonase YvrE
MAAGAAHGISVDQEQNLYLAAVGRGGVQKFRPRQGANPAYLVGRHVYSAWK